jgi:Protein of unknown function (DUF664)
MPSLPVTFAQEVIDLPARGQFEAFIDEHRRALNRCLDGLTEEQARRSLVPSRTTLLGLVKHATFLEKVWFDEAFTGRSRAEIGIPALSDESFILQDSDTIATVQQAHRAACESSRRATSSLGPDDKVYGYRLGPLPLRWVYLHVLRELAQHCGHSASVSFGAPKKMCSSSFVVWSRMSFTVPLPNCWLSGANSSVVAASTSGW